MVKATSFRKAMGIKVIRYSYTGNIHRLDHFSCSNVLVFYLYSKIFFFQTTIVKSHHNFLSTCKESEISEVPAECDL